MKPITSAVLDRTAPAPPVAARHPVWSPWPVTPRPATTAEERTFVCQLVAATDGQPGRFGRTDVTLLLNALRCGVEFARLGGFAPGLRADRLLGAYLALERARAASAAAWTAIATSCEQRPGSMASSRTEAAVAAIQTHGQAAARLLPVKVVFLAQVARRHPRDLPEAIHRATVEVSVQAAHVERIEAAINRAASECSTGTEADEWAADLGALLYDPLGDAVTGHAAFLPGRVGLLDPTRVAALLGERPQPTL